MLGCKKMGFELKSPFQSCTSCVHKHRAHLEFKDVYKNHNAEESPNCLWVDAKYKKKGVKFGG